MAKTKKTTGGLINLTIDNPILPLLKKLPKEVQDAIEGVVNDWSAEALERIKNATPRDRGTAAANWKVDSVSSSKPGDVKDVISNETPYINVLEFGGYPVVAIRGKKKKKAKAKKRKKKKKKQDVSAAMQALIDSSTKAAKRVRTGAGIKSASGKAILGGFDPGPRTSAAPGGDPEMLSNVSNQAKSGMVRRVLGDITDPFVFELEEAIDQAFLDIDGGQ